MIKVGAPEDSWMTGVNDLHDFAEFFAGQLIHIGTQRLLFVHFEWCRVVEFLVLDDALD